MKKIVVLLFGALFLFQCTSSDKPDTTRIDSPIAIDTLIEEKKDAPVESRISYEEELSALPLTEASSLRALELFRDVYDSNDSTENDKALLTYLGFQTKLLDFLNNHIGDDQEFYEQLNTLTGDSVAPEAVAYNKKLHTQGITLGQSEGYVYYQLYPETVGAYFRKGLSPSTKEYFQQFTKETNHPYSEDGGLTLSVKALADRLMFWDRFLTAYPGHVFAVEAKERYNAYLYSFLMGEDNTPAFNSESHKLEQEFSEAYVYVSKKYPGTKTARLINEYLTVLTDNRNTYNDKIRKFVQNVKVY